MIARTDFPALAGRVVTDAHARICAEYGHATHTVDGRDTGSCPRCGEVSVREVAATDVEIGDEVSVWGRMLTVTDVTDDVIIVGPVSIPRVGTATVRIPHYTTDDAYAAEGDAAAARESSACNS